MTTEALDSVAVLETKSRMQRREWIAERIGWTVLAGIIVAGLLGFLGPGLLSHVHDATPNDRLEIDYERFEHMESPAELQMRVRTSDERDLAVTIASTFANSATLEEISPRPDSVELADGAHVYHFATTEGAAEVLIIFRFKYNTFGWLTHEIRLSGNTQLQVDQFVFP